jgi:hypothetical protein
MEFAVSTAIPLKSSWLLLSIRQRMRHSLSFGLKRLATRKMIYGVMKSPIAMGGSNIAHWGLTRHNPSHRALGVKLQIVMGPIIRGAVMFDDSQRQLDPQDRQPPALPTISPLGIALRTRRTSPLSQSDLVPWHERDVPPTAFGGSAEVRRTWGNRRN